MYLKVRVLLWKILKKYIFIWDFLVYKVAQQIFFGLAVLLRDDLFAVKLWLFSVVFVNKLSTWFSVIPLALAQILACYASLLVKNAPELQLNDTNVLIILGPVIFLVNKKWVHNARLQISKIKQLLGLRKEHLGFFLIIQCL